MDANKPTIFAPREMDKTLVVKQHPVYPLYSIGYKEGGGTPLPLQGQYTSPQAAERAIERFLIGSNRKQGGSQ